MSPTATTRLPVLDLSFDAELGTVEGVLALTQEWAAEQGVSRDDRLSLRLVLDELLTNISFHASPAPEETSVGLTLEIVRHGDGRDVRIGLRDDGAPFNPLSYEAQPVGTLGETPTGGRGLSLVRLLTTHGEYARADGCNRLSLALPLGDKQEADSQPDPARNAAPERPPLRVRLRGLWSGNLAFRQTVLFALCSIVLIWGGMGVYYADISAQQKERAEALGGQALTTQSLVSSNYLGIMIKSQKAVLDALRGRSGLFENEIGRAHV